MAHLEDQVALLERWHEIQDGELLALRHQLIQVQSSVVRPPPPDIRRHGS